MLQPFQEDVFCTRDFLYSSPTPNWICGGENKQDGRNNLEKMNYIHFFTYKNKQA